MRGHGLLAADLDRLVEVGIDDFALVERQLDPLPICVKVLIGAGNAVHGNSLPSFVEALLFFARPFDPWLGRRRVLLTFLPPLRRRRRLRRVVLLVEVGLLLFFFVDVLGAVSEPVIVDATPRRCRDGLCGPCLLLCEETRARRRRHGARRDHVVHHTVIRRRHPVGEGELPSAQGNKINGGELPFCRRPRCFVRSPRARLGKPGMAWARRMDESPNLGENEEPGAWLGRIPPSG
jgi:hypothetical protein